MFAKPSSSDRGSVVRLALLLIILLAVPSIGVLWFVSVAMNNEQLASRQRMADAYRLHLRGATRILTDHWQAKTREIQQRRQELTPAALFAEVASGGFADALLAYNPEGRLLYPNELTRDEGVDKSDARWSEAESLEFQTLDLPAAIAIYRDLASENESEAAKRQASLALARCLFRNGEHAEACEIILGVPQDTAVARDLANHEMLALEFLGDTKSNAGEKILLRLEQRLRNYNDLTLSSAQRVFLMNRLTELLGKETQFPTFATERTAASFVAAQPVPTIVPLFLRTPLADIWQLGTPDGKTLLLFGRDRIVSESETLLSSTASLDAATIRLLAPDQNADPDEYLAVTAGDVFPGWRLSLSLNDKSEIERAATRRNTITLWTGLMVILATCALMLLIARTVQHQMQLARLKNDLVGTVSHELKTPLASMRLLVDTLLDAESFDENLTREYLQLIGKENERLCRVMDNFLAFSRMDRRMHTFTFVPCDVRKLILRSVEAAGDRFHAADCQLDVRVDDDLPTLNADTDAIVTAILNLLENAYKYSDPVRQIQIHASEQAGRIRIAVADNGIGLSRRTAAKVCQRFYQVDRSLARKGQGCGLGLSIVQFIVSAHHGRLQIDSLPGSGSTFTILLPVAEASQGREIAP
ncbi:sensor histidine kinase [Novipirellula artificiosorum]|uniref:histidine kinase n=1 Tax=Novipirellula artificiosorum TaxID=2528016 RepID=A0A5C6E4R9_9BACT|nr:HAMP domain-containing sensor histidine kinase [Novipirellula artificiosorum]TWU42426.1 Alkaline phosphatase synthesis sensor protein PhoR [Novipirellula artificiosorum]